MPRRSRWRSGTESRAGARTPGPAGRLRRRCTATGSRRCRWISTTPRPGSGFRHQQTGGPPPCGTVQRRRSRRRAAPASARRWHPPRSALTASVGDLRLPRQTQQPPAIVAVAAEDCGTLPARPPHRRPTRGTTPGSAAQQDAVAPDDHGAVGERGIDACARRGRCRSAKSLRTASGGSSSR